MSIVARLIDYLSPLAHSSREISQEGPTLSPEFVCRVLHGHEVTVKAVNDITRKHVLADERRYWERVHARAETDEDLELAAVRLKEIDDMEAASHD